jgi:hypothetical protein
MGTPTSGIGGSRGDEAPEPRSVGETATTELQDPLGHELLDVV